MASLSTRRQCGLVAEPGDARALADRIRTFYATPDLRARYGANARAAGLEFDRRQQVAKYMDLFRQVARPQTMPGAAGLAKSRGL